MKKLNRNTKGQDGKLRQCYVYEIRIDGVVRLLAQVLIAEADSFVAL